MCINSVIYGDFADQGANYSALWSVDCVLLYRSSKIHGESPIRLLTKESYAKYGTKYRIEEKVEMHWSSKPPLLCYTASSAIFVLHTICSMVQWELSYISTLLCYLAKWFVTCHISLKRSSAF